MRNDCRFHDECNALWCGKRCISNEAGMGSAAITAAAATTDNPVRQGYINMTGTFWDTIVVCTITGLAIASSGVLGMTDAAGNMLTGSDVTIAAFETVLGSAGGWLVTIGITLFAFSTILGWEYHGEKAFEYLLGTHRFNMVYRLVFLCCVFRMYTDTESGMEFLGYCQCADGNPESDLYAPAQW